ncbi:hypothetical protein CRUP_032715, partial [Coryphaenoides rupestris]
SLHEVLSDFEVFRPLSTDSEGRFLSHVVSAPHLDQPRPRSRRHAPHGGRAEQMKDNREEDRGGGRTVFYNMTIFGQELHLRLQQSSRLVAPGATVEWQEEDGGIVRLPLVDAACHYSGAVVNMPDTAVALSTCHGLVGSFLGSESHLEILKQNQKRSKPRTARSRREVEEEEEELFNVEVLLGVDYSVLLFHGRDHIQHYLLTLMNIVNEIYQDRSLGANVNIILVRIIMLSASKELIEVWNPSQSLENVCRWAFLQQRAEQSPEHHDHAIYITRQEFGPAGMQGYAPAMLQ